MSRRKSNDTTQVCKLCGNEFEVQRLPHIVHGKLHGWRKQRREYCDNCQHTAHYTNRIYTKLRGRPPGPYQEPPPNTICDICGKPFFKPEAWKRRTKAHLCSKECTYKERSERLKGKRPQGWIDNPPTTEARKQGALRGVDNPAWKGGITYRQRKGKYGNVKYVRCPEEFADMARKDGYVMEHRLIMAQHLGRSLLRSEVVHHLNHNIAHNDIENLKLFSSNAEHKRYEGETGYFKEYYRTRTSPQSSL